MIYIAVGYNLQAVMLDYNLFKWLVITSVQEAQFILSNGHNMCHE